jgi:hypothetical protein
MARKTGRRTFRSYMPNVEQKKVDKDYIQKIIKIGGNSALLIGIYRIYTIVYEEILEKPKIIYKINDEDIHFNRFMPN